MNQHGGDLEAVMVGPGQGGGPAVVAVRHGGLGEAGGG